jgi:hypothetical protein
MSGFLFSQFNSNIFPPHQSKAEGYKRTQNTGKVTLLYVLKS